METISSEKYSYVYNLHYRELYRLNLNDEIEYYCFEEDTWKRSHYTKEQVYAFFNKNVYNELNGSSIKDVINTLKKDDNCFLTHYSIKKATKEDIKTIDKQSLNALFYAEGGAMGYPGLTMLISSEDKKILYSNSGTCEVTQIEITKLFDGFQHMDGFLSQDFQWLIINGNQWVYFNLGMGNHLYLRSDLYFRIGNLIFDVKQGNRYRKWIDLTGIEFVI